MIKFSKDPYFLISAGLAAVALISLLTHKDITPQKASRNIASTSQHAIRPANQNHLSQLRQIQQNHQQGRRFAHSLMAFHQEIKSYSKIIEVGTQSWDDTTSLSKALSLIEDGGTIKIHGGTHTFLTTTIFDKDLKIIGDKDTILNVDQNIFLHTKGRLHLENLTILGPKNLILLRSEGEELILKNVAFKDTNIVLSKKVKAVAENISIEGFPIVDGGNNNAITMEDNAFLTIKQSSISNVKGAFLMKSFSRVEADQMKIATTQESFYFENNTTPSLCSNCEFKEKTLATSHFDLLSRNKL